MKSFVLKSINKNNEVLILETNVKGLIYKFHNKGKINEIIIYNPTIIYLVINKSFSKKYKRILGLFFESTDESDNSEGNLAIALDELARLRSILLKRYANMLKNEDLEKFLKELKYLENEIRLKIFNIRLIKEQKNVHTNEEKCKSR